MVKKQLKNTPSAGKGGCVGVSHQLVPRNDYGSPRGCEPGRGLKYWINEVDENTGSIGILASYANAGWCCDIGM
jgi:hypothetical protein